MAEIHAGRRRRAQEKIAGAGADAALITSGPNVRYLTGLASSNAALLLPADGAAVLATDSRYTLAAQRDCPDLELVIERFLETRMAAEMTARGQRTVAFEAHEMTVERHAELAAKADVKSRARAKTAEVKGKAAEVSGQVRRSQVVQRRWPLAVAAAGVILISIAVWRRRKT